MAALACAPALSLSGGGADAPVVVAGQDAVPVSDRNVADAALRFVRAMASRDADDVWMFASEEEQDAFGTEQAALAAYADAYPAFSKVKRIAFQRFWQEGDTPFAELAVKASDGASYRATLGFWLDDAGDWKLVSCDVVPTSDRIAGL